MAAVTPNHSYDSGKTRSSSEQEHPLQARIHIPDDADDTNRAQTQTSHVICNGQEIKVHAIQTGTVAVKRSHLTNRTAHFLTPLKISIDKHFTDYMPIWVWVVEHPEGIILIDTGENAAVMTPGYFDPAGTLISKYNRRNLKFNISKDHEIGCQLRKLGIKKTGIKNVVLTHLHLDHTDGIKDFPNAEFIVNREELRNPSGHFPELVPDWFDPKKVTYKPKGADVFNQAYAITESEDMLLIPTPGHTEHHASVLFKTDAFDILFAGDVCYNQRQLIERDIPGINVNYKKSRKTYDNILSYAQRNKLIFLPSHDSNAAYRLNKTQFLK
jgi:glyoxylase-like metal-dependent hydrolase (beta-lactamase superfamily II)